MARKVDKPSPGTADAPEKSANESTASAKNKTADTHKAPDKPKSLSDILAEASPAKLEALSKNLSDALLESQQILMSMGSYQAKSQLGAQTADPFGFGEAWSKIGAEFARHPEKMFSAQMNLWEGHLNIWRSFLTHHEEKPSADKKFSDPEWNTNPFFEMIRKSYELNSQWMLSLVSASTEIDEHTRRKATFLARQTAEAFSPTNFFSTNPQALRAMLETGGESLIQGLRNIRKDIARGHGRLLISQTDASAFEIGKNIATAPGKVVFKNELLELIQYAPTTETTFEVPLVIFPPWINKYYILDLKEENSMIRWLTSQGYTVFIVSWRSADHSMKDVTWDDYVKLGAYDVTRKVCELMSVEKVNVVGYCIGGTMLSSALAHMATHGEDHIESATFFAAQADFEEAGDLRVFTDEHALSYIESRIDLHDGIMAGEDMGETFNYLRPADLVWRYVIDNYMLGKTPKPFDLLYWNSDQTNIPGKTHKTYLECLYRDNDLSNGQFKVLGEKVSLADIQLPCLFQAGRDDHIAPFRSVYRTAKRFGGDCELVLAGSGHIAGVVNHPDAKKYQHWVNPDLGDSIESWLEQAEEHKGSWWPYWGNWLEKRSGDRIAAPKVKDAGLGDAPGDYVRMRLEDLGVGASAK